MHRGRHQCIIIIVIRYHKQGNGGCFSVFDAREIQKALKYMKTDRNTVKYAAELSRLRLNEDETEKMVNELGKMAKIISALECSDIPEISSDKSLSFSAMREDEVNPSAEREKILENAPEHTGEYFCAPDTFEQGGAEE